MVRTRNSTRARTAQTNRRTESTKAIKNQLKWKAFVPPLRQPSVNRNFTFPFVTHVGHAYPATATNVAFRVEDVILSIAKTVDMTSSWYPLIRIRPIACLAYGQIEKTDELVPAFTLVTFDPSSGSQGASRGVIGDIDDPARTGFHFPFNVQQQLLGWDGTAGTSAKLAGVTSTTEQYVSTYWNVVVYIDSSFTASVDWHRPCDRIWKPSDCREDVESRYRIREEPLKWDFARASAAIPNAVTEAFEELAL